MDQLEAGEESRGLAESSRAAETGRERDKTMPVEVRIERLRTDWLRWWCCAMWCCALNARCQMPDAWCDAGVFSPVTRGVAA